MATGRPHRGCGQQTTPRLLEFEGPEGHITSEGVRTQQSLLYFAQVLVEESEIISNWGELKINKKQTYRATLLMKVLGNSYEELKERLEESCFTTHLAGF